jgi:streptomycin 6-kinase
MTPLEGLLLERLGPSLYELGHPLAERLEILVTAAAAVWRPAPGSGLPTGADKARQLAGFVTTEWEELGHPCTEAAVEHALACAARRIAAHDDERAVLVHGDVHQLNALQVPGRDTFKLVDPDGMLAEAECDLGVMIRQTAQTLTRSRRTARIMRGPPPGAASTSGRPAMYFAWTCEALN